MILSETNCYNIQAVNVMLICLHIFNYVTMILAFLKANDVFFFSAMKGYRLTNLGYDYLALNQFFKSEQLESLGTMIGAGKESDVYIAAAGARCGRPSDGSEGHLVDFPNEGDSVVVKFHRLGRTSFRKVKEKREYHQHRSSCSWLYLDRLASKREFVMMQVSECFTLDLHRAFGVMVFLFLSLTPTTEMLSSCHILLIACHFTEYFRVF